MADPIRTALYGALVASPALTALVGTRIYHRVAPQAATFPVCIFHKHSGTPRWTFAGRPVQWDLWAVKGLCQGSSATRAEEIAAAIDDALNDAALTITGREHLFLLRDSDINLGEDEDGVQYHTVGALYRLASE